MGEWSYGEIEFTQYIAPHGRTKTITIFRPQDIADKAAAILSQGFRFEAEIVPGLGNMVSLTIADDEMDHAIEVVPNGPGVGEAVDRLISNFAALEKGDG
ncbi:MAG: hypothetical protein QNJ62_04995 [Methyloceanibacter sp.]|nr:hypothetical protein [Methyloceanibacter sp.]